MKRKLKLLVTSLLGLALAACGSPSTPEPTPSGGDPGQVDPVTTYTVIFEVDGTRYATLKVKKGEAIGEGKVNDPTAPSGKVFAGWYLNGNKVDIATYVVNSNVTFTAKFDDAGEKLPDLSVDATKEAGKTYYMVLGWWETTAKNDDGTPKQTSFMVKDDAVRIYANIRSYLKLTGVADSDINNIQFRNYSSATVADMGTAINGDADVDIVFGVGNNINSSSGANVSLHNSSNDFKFQEKTGSTQTQRYVACTTYANDHGVALFDWLKNTDAGRASLSKLLSDDEIRASLAPVTIDLTVTVHGDTDAVTHLTDKDTAITMPTITVPSGKHFAGFATSATGEVVLKKAINATLKYDDVKALATGKTLDLYPVFEQDATADLVAYVQINGNNLTEAEGRLLEARFNASLTDKTVTFNFVTGDAATFSGAVGTDADVIIGGNNPLKDMAAHADGALVNAGAKHFASTNRKVLISGTCSADHLTLAKKLYDFVKTDAPAYALHSAVWTKGGDWVTEAEKTALVTKIGETVTTYLAVGADKTAESVYNLTCTFDDVTTEGNKVADLGAATKALRDGKGADLVIGCGGNVDTASGLTVAAKQTIATSLVAANRYVALINDNGLARYVYENAFTVPTAA